MLELSLRVGKESFPKFGLWPERLASLRKAFIPGWGEVMSRDPAGGKKAKEVTVNGCVLS